MYRPDRLLWVIHIGRFYYLVWCFQCRSLHLRVADPLCCPSLKEVHLSVKGVPGQLTINFLEYACKQSAVKLGHRTLAFHRWAFARGLALARKRGHAPSNLWPHWTERENSILWLGFIFVPQYGDSKNLDILVGFSCWNTHYNCIHGVIVWCASKTRKKQNKKTSHQSAFISGDGHD